MYLDGRNIEIFIKEFKIFEKRDLERIFEELKMLLDLNDNYLKIKGCCIDEENNFFYLFFDFYSKTLFEVIFVSNYEEKYEIIRKLCLFLLEIHSKGIIHRDLKIDLFYLDLNGNLKIFDFSNAIYFKNRKNSSFFNFFTPKYVSPENFYGNPSFNLNQDIWSMACILIEILIEYEKFDELSIQKLLNKIFHNFDSKNFSLTPKIPKNIEEDLALIISKCLRPNFAERNNIIELINQLNIFLRAKDLNEIYINNYDKQQILQYLNETEQDFKINLDEDGDQQDIGIEFCQTHLQKQSNLIAIMFRFFLL